MDRLQTLWSYYQGLAEKSGLAQDQNGNPKQASYSLFPFYQSFPIDGLSTRLNPLTRAFLGDEKALDELDPIGTDGLVPPEAADTSGPEWLKKAIQDCCQGERTPNASQVHAIETALTHPISIIQGPPGTGKTETIKNLLLCLRALRPEAKIAVVSANGEALRNIKDLLDRSVLKSQYAFLGSVSSRKEFHAVLAKDPRVANDPKLAALCSSSTAGNGYTFAPALLDYYPIMISTIHSMRNCIKGGGFENQFDYVIADECSQVSTMLGIVAMASAKRLVLLGDDQQLAPIHKDNISGVEQHDAVQALGEYYLDERENSFMTACHERFGDKAGNVLLNEHYRCHPGIIGFCNEQIYGGQLEIQTADDGRLPIRIRWYEGDYWERQPSDKKSDKESDKESGEEQPAEGNSDQKSPEKSQSDERKVRHKDYNRKQIDIFLQEEYPVLLAAMQKDPNYSVCVLSPYRYQLELLKQALDEYNAGIKAHLGESTLEPENTEIPDIPQLTIHKAQGKGYDYVCVMPVVDTGSNTWSQRKRITNVAVSRAKKVLCYITSACWMPEWLQRRMVGYRVPTTADESNLYLRKLIRYVYDRQTAEDLEAGYGLIQTKLDSAFAKVPYYRLMNNKDKATAKQPVDGSKGSGPELSFLNTLWHEIRRPGSPLADFDLYREVHLSDVEGTPSDNSTDVGEYVGRGSRFDIAVCKDDKVHYLIEVDGSYHRDPTDVEQMSSDARKDKAVEGLDESFKNSRYKRIPTDGSTAHEIDDIETAIKAADEAGIITPRLLAAGKGEKNRPWVPSDSSQIDSLTGRLKDIFRDFCFDLEMDPDRTNESLQKMTFKCDLPDYRDIQQARYYLLRYAIAYAFEYSVMYRIALANLMAETNITVYSFGCGSKLDGLSLLHAKEQLQKAGVSVGSLYYRGIDLVKWPVQFDLEGMDSVEFYPMGMDDFMDPDNKAHIKNMRCNIMCFPKLLSEDLDKPDGGSTVIDRFCERLKMQDFGRDRIVLCISHRGRYEEDGRPKDRRVADKVVNAMRDNKGNYHLVESVPLSDVPSLGDIAGRLITKRDCAYPYICFRDADGKDEDNIKALDPQFQLPPYFWSYLHVSKGSPDTASAQQDGEASDAEDAEPVYEQDRDKLISLFNHEYMRNPITRTKSICFQVLTFQRQPKKTPAK